MSDIPDDGCLLTPSEIVCRRCKFRTMLNSWIRIIADTRPDLARQAKAGQIRQHVCPNCSETADSAAPLLYVDRRKLFAVFLPSAGLTAEGNQGALLRLVGDALGAASKSERDAFVRRVVVAKTLREFPRIVDDMERNDVSLSIRRAQRETAVAGRNHLEELSLPDRLERMIDLYDDGEPVALMPPDAIGPFFDLLLRELKNAMDGRNETRAESLQALLNLLLPIRRLREQLLTLPVHERLERLIEICDSGAPLPLGAVDAEPQGELFLLVQNEIEHAPDSPRRDALIVIHLFLEREKQAMETAISLLIDAVNSGNIRALEKTLSVHACPLAALFDIFHNLLRRTHGASAEGATDARLVFNTLVDQAITEEVRHLREAVLSYLGQAEWRGALQVLKERPEIIDERVKLITDRIFDKAKEDCHVDGIALERVITSKASLVKRIRAVGFDAATAEYAASLLQLEDDYATLTTDSPKSVRDMLDKIESHSGHAEALYVHPALATEESVQAVETRILRARQEGRVGLAEKLLTLRDELLERLFNTVIRQLMASQNAQAQREILKGNPHVLSAEMIRHLRTLSARTRSQDLGALFDRLEVFIQRCRRDGISEAVTEPFQSDSLFRIERQFELLAEQIRKGLITKETATRKGVEHLQSIQTELENVSAFAEYLAELPEQEAGTTRCLHAMEVAALVADVVAEIGATADSCRAMIAHGRLLLQYGNIADAICRLEAALSAAKSVNDTALRCEAQFYLAAGHGAQGNWSLAAHLFSGVHEIKPEMSVAANLATAHCHLGESERAIEIYERAKISEAKLSDKEAFRLHLGLGELYLQLERAGEAIPELRLALACAERRFDFSSQAATRMALGTACAVDGDVEQCMDHLEQARALTSRLGEAQARARVLANIGSVLAMVGNTMETTLGPGAALQKRNSALESFREATRLFREANAQSLLRRTLTAQGKVEEQLGNTEDAYNSYCEALTLLEWERDTLGETRHKHHLQTRSSDLYTRGVGVSIKMLDSRDGRAKDHHELAFQFAEAGKSRILADLIGQANTEAALSSTNGREAFSPAAAVSQDFRIADACRALPTDTVLLEYSFLPHESCYVLFVVASNGLIGEPIRISAAVTDDIYAFYEVMEGLEHHLRSSVGARHSTVPEIAARYQSEFQSLLERLGSALIPPPVIRRLRGVKRLLIAPDAWLHHAPFAALRVAFERGTNYLIGSPESRDGFELCVSPSASTFRACRSKMAHRTVTPKTALGLLISDPNPDDEDLCLPGASAIMESLRHSHFSMERSVHLSQRRATKAEFVRLSVKANVVCFYGHGIYDHADALSSGLVFCSSDGGRDTLTVRELLDWPSSTRFDECSLLVTPACWGLRLDPTVDWAAREIVGLPAAFLARGVASILGSLWRAHSNPAVVLLNRFFDEYLRGSTATAALRQAQLELQRSSYLGDHPYFWAPFHIIGDYKAWP